GAREAVGAAEAGGQRNTTALTRSRCSTGNDNSAVSPPSLTTLRRRSLSELSSTVPSVVQPTGTFGSVVSRTRAIATFVASSGAATDAVTSTMAAARLSATDVPAPYSAHCRP